MEEKVDESANRTATALHCFASLIVVSPLFHKKALFTILRLVKEKNLNTGERYDHFVVSTVEFIGI
jgi:hypothetical protein